MMHAKLTIAMIGSIVGLLVHPPMASADVLPCRGAPPSEGYADEGAFVEWPAKAGAVTFGVVVGAPLGIAVALVAMPLAVVSQPVWSRAFRLASGPGEATLYGICCGLYTFGYSAEAGYYLVGTPPFVVKKAVWDAPRVFWQRVTDEPNNPAAPDGGHESPRPD